MTGKNGTIAELNAKSGSIQEISGYLKATENFSGEVPGTTGTDIAFVDTDNSGNGCTLSIIESTCNHKHVLQFNDQSGSTRCQIEHNFASAQANRTEEFYLAIDDITKENCFTIYFRESTTYLFRIYITTDDMGYVGGTSGQVKANFITTSVMFHVKVVLDDTNNKFDVYINGDLEIENIAYQNNSTVGLDNIMMTTDNTQTGYKVFFNALGDSADANYEVGDNLEMETGGKNGSISETNKKGGSIE